VLVVLRIAVLVVWTCAVGRLMEMIPSTSPGSTVRPAARVHPLRPP